jgi:predicted nucleic acid-binding protein
LAEVLGRPSVAKRLAVIGRTAREVLFDYVEAVVVVDPTSVPRAVPDDPDDDHVIAAAVAARAAVIVSGDTHLVAVKRFQEIEILTVAQTIERITSRP